MQQNKLYNDACFETDELILCWQHSERPLLRNMKSTNSDLTCKTPIMKLNSQHVQVCNLNDLPDSTQRSPVILK
jgi:hypothetical protein